jgi:VWFA-related protein
VLGIVLSWSLAAAAVVQPSVPGARTEIVNLDVVVTDTEGRPVTGLLAHDFVVLEDGKPQRVTHFVARAQPAEGEAAAGGAAPAVGAPGGRTILLLVDDLHLAANGLEFAKAALGAVVDESLRPDDRVAVVTSSGSSPAQWLNGDRAAVRQAIGRIAPREAAPAPASSQMTPGQAELILSGDTIALQLAARVMAADASGAFADLTPRAALEGGRSTPQASGLEDPRERAAAEEAKRQAVPILNQAMRYSVITLGATERALRALAGFPGPRICLLVSNGFLMGARTSEERTRELQGVVDAAMRSESTVYTLDPQGLGAADQAQTPGSAASPGGRSRLDHMTEMLYRGTLRRLADESGGFLVTAGSDLAEGIRRVLADDAVAYSIAYEPSNLKRDGRFRRVEVRLPAHSRYRVRTRKGYLAPGSKGSDREAVPDPGPPFALTEEEARSVLASTIPSQDIPVRLAADYLELPSTGPLVIVGVQVDVAGMRFEERGGHRRADVELVGGFYDAEGKPAGSVFGTHTALDLVPADWERAKREGLRHRQPVPLSPGRYDVRLVARERRLGQIGGATRSIEVPDLKDHTLAMSSVFLSATAPGPEGAPVGELLQDVQTAARFERDRSLTFQFYVYNAEDARDVVLQAQVLSGDRVIAASKPRNAVLQTRGGVPLPETNTLPLDGLAPGPYRLRVVVAAHERNAVVHRDVDFTVE